MKKVKENSQNICISFSHTLLFQTNHEMAAAAALGEVHQSLTWIGFNTQAHCNSICNEAVFESLENLVGLTKKDIREMADGYEKHTHAQGCNPFGLH